MPFCSLNAERERLISYHLQQADLVKAVEQCHVQLCKHWYALHHVQGIQVHPPGLVLCIIDCDRLSGHVQKHPLVAAAGRSQLSLLHIRRLELQPVFKGGEGTLHRWC